MTATEGGTYHRPADYYINTDRLQLMVQDGYLSRRITEEQPLQSFHMLIITQWVRGETVVAVEKHYSDFGMSSRIALTPEGKKLLFSEL